MKYLVNRFDRVSKFSSVLVGECSSLDESREFILQDCANKEYSKYDYFVVYGKGRKLAKFSWKLDRWVAE